ncbi:hypothetical protein GGR54DRAFT_644182 [Hypoxylon sp. NC1633]|nr:hypothetical protein GGR54DRAFT_644182 [Hypoxylon sp. NC1633]
MAKEGVISIPMDIRSPTEIPSNRDSYLTLPPFSAGHMPDADHFTHSGSNHDLDSGTQKRKLEISKGDCQEQKRRKTEMDIQLPPEIMSMIISSAIDSEPRCALDLLVPDWSTCIRGNPELEKELDLTRIVTYTRGVGKQSSTLSTMFGHEYRGDILLSMKSLDDNILRLNAWYCNEAVRSFFQEGTQTFHLGVGDLSDDVAKESSQKSWNKSFPIRGERLKDILPFDDEPIETIKRRMPSGTPYTFRLLRHIVVHSPLTLMKVDACSLAGPDTKISDANLELLDVAIDLDRGSPLWLSWSQMPMLESVLLDLRIYSHDLNTDRGCLCKSDIIGRAQEMSRWLQLKLLVIAGLQSYSFETSYKSYTAERIEEDDEVDGEPNWIKVFMPAVRPGGKLILVDRLIDGDGLFHSSVVGVETRSS